MDTPEQAIEYRHNVLGQRVAKLVNGQVVEQYLWQDLITLLAVYDGSGNLKQRFEHTVGHTPTSFTQNGQRYYIQTDHLGSPRVIADSNGSVVRSIRYDSYGNITHDSDPEFAIPFGFAGGLYDTDTGLIRFGYRDYDPETGRWTARDPIGFGGGDTNLYGYVLSNPINYIDSKGLHYESAGSAARSARRLATGRVRTGGGAQASVVYKNDGFSFNRLFHQGGPYEMTTPSHATVRGKYFYDSSDMVVQPMSKLQGMIESGVIAFPRYSVTKEQAILAAQRLADELGVPVEWVIVGVTEGQVDPRQTSCQ